MREVVTLLVATCDICGKRYEKDGDSQVITREFVWAATEFEIDVDADCDSTLADCTVTFLVDHARTKPRIKAKAKKRPAPIVDAVPADQFYEQFRNTEGGFTCPYPKCGRSDLMSPGALGTHHKRSHGVNIREYITAARSRKRRTES